MAPNKNAFMTTAATVSTLGLIVSVALHFTPWPHNCNNNFVIAPPTPQNTIEVNLSAHDLEITQISPVANYNDIKPCYIHLKGEPANRCYPLTFGPQTTDSTNDAIWARFEYKPGQTMLIRLTKNQ